MPAGTNGSTGPALPPTQQCRPESLAKARLEVIDGEVNEEVRGELVAAS